MVERNKYKTSYEEFIQTHLDYCRCIFAFIKNDQWKTDNSWEDAMIMFLMAEKYILSDYLGTYADYKRIYGYSDKEN